jgi:hypothetical protein
VDDEKYRFLVCAKIFNSSFSSLLSVKTTHWILRHENDVIDTADDLRSSEILPLSPMFIKYTFSSLFTLTCFRVAIKATATKV